MKNFVLILLFTPLILGAQSNDLPLKVGFSFSPEINGLIFLTQNQRTEQNFGFSGAISLEYKIDNHFSLGTGIGFGVKSYESIITNLTFGTDINPQTGFKSTSELNTVLKTNEFNIPLFLKYRPFKNNRLYLLGAVGLDYQVPKSTETIVYYGNGDVEKLNSISIEPFLNLTTTFAIGFMQPISTKIDLTIEPFYKMYLKPYAFPSVRMFNAGLRLGLEMDL